MHEESECESLDEDRCQHEADRASAWRHRFELSCSQQISLVHGSV